MGTKFFRKTDIKDSAIANEQGAALIIVLVMLLLLTILGTSMLATSTTELKIAGNYRNTEEAFYTAEAVLDVASVCGGIFTSIIPDYTNNWPAKTTTGKQLEIVNNPSNYFISHGDNYDNHKNPDYTDFNRITITSGGGRENTADVKVKYLHDDDPPAGSGTQIDSSVGSGSGGEYKANIYAVTVIAYGPNDTTAKLERQVARVVLK